MVAVVFDLNRFVQQITNVIYVNIIVPVECSGPKYNRGYMALTRGSKAEYHAFFTLKELGLIRVFYDRGIKKGSRFNGILHRKVRTDQQLVQLTEFFFRKRNFFQ
ncbi:hypothetical protein D3C86_967820 [compost metagenome]